MPTNTYLKRGNIGAYTVALIVFIFWLTGKRHQVAATVGDVAVGFSIQKVCLVFPYEIW